MLVDGAKLIQMVDEFCTEKRPNSKDIRDMVLDCRTVKEPLLVPTEYKPNYENDTNVSDTIKLDLAEELFTKMMEEMETISIKDFLQHTMYLYDMSEYDILKDKRRS